MADRWLLFFHIVAALWLAGGVIGGTVVRAQTRRAADLAAKVFGLRTAWRLMTVLTLPGALLAGLLGIGLVPMRGFRYSQGWVEGSLLLYLVMILVTLFYVAPMLLKTVRAAEASLAAGSPTPAFQKLTSAKLPSILADVNALGIVILTFLMAVKPS